MSSFAGKSGISIDGNLYDVSACEHYCGYEKQGAFPIG